MKNFLKSFTIFVSVALLMGACSEEQTEDVEGGTVTSPTIENLQAGNQRAQITLLIDESDVDVTSSIISWSNDDQSVVGSVSIPVEPGVSKTYTVQGNGVDIADLEPGNYTFSVVGVSSSEVSMPATESLYIYGEATYGALMPEVISAVALENYDLQLTWGEVVEDCESLYIAYTDVSGEACYYDEMLIATNLQTILDDANTSQTITYVATFYPEGGLDEVVISGGSYTVDSTVDSPQITSAKVGVDRFEVTWQTPSSIEGIDYYVVVYGNNSRYFWVDADDAPAMANQEVSYDEANSSYTTMIEASAGDYALSIYSVASSGLTSTPVSFGDDVISVYDQAEYSLPAIASITNSVGVVEVIFEELDGDCRELVLTYNSTAGGLASVMVEVSDQELEFGSGVGSGVGSVSVTIEDVLEGSTIEVMATYYPENVISTTDDAVVKVGVDSLLVPYVSLSAPVLSGDYVSDYSVGGASTIEVSWSVDGDEAQYVDKFIVTCGDCVAQVDGAEMSCIFSTTDGADAIVVDRDYNISVVAVNFEGVASEVSNEVVAYTYNEDSYSFDENISAPTVVMDEATGDIVATWIVTEDLVEIVVTYGLSSNKTMRSVDGLSIGDELQIELSYEEGCDDFTYSAAFCPSKGVNNVVVESGRVEIVGAETAE